MRGQATRRRLWRQQGDLPSENEVSGDRRGVHQQLVAIQACLVDQIGAGDEERREDAAARAP